MQGNSREAALGYVAGIIDGEGAIFITRDPYNHKRSVHRLEIRVGMIDRKALDFIVLACKIGKVTKEKPYHHKRPLYRWVISKRQDIKDFLDQIFPYLLTKKPQAVLAYEYLNHVTNFPGRKLNDDEVKLRHRFYNKMRKLNGVAAPATTERKGKRGRYKSIRLEATV